MRVVLTVPVLLVLFACGTTEPPIVSVVEVAQAAQTALTGGPGIQFIAKALDASGATIAGKEFIWSSSDPSVATIDSSTGLATVVGSGPLTIAATTDGVTGNMSLTIIPAPRIAVSQDTAAFVGSVGGAPPAAQIVNVINGGGGSLRDLTVDIVYAGSQIDWLDVVLADSQTPTRLTITPLTAGVPAGEFSANVMLSSPDDRGGAVVITVSLSLTATPASMDVDGH